MKLLCPLCRKKIKKNEAAKIGYRFYHKKCAKGHEPLEKSFRQLHAYFNRLHEE